MSHPALVLSVKFKSGLPPEEIEKVIEARIDDFRALEGLTQKYYLEDAETGEISGLYFWESEQAFTDYRNSELKASIASAYQTIGEPRVEVFKVTRPLRD